MPKANFQYNFLLRKTVGKKSAGDLEMKKKKKLARRLNLLMVGSIKLLPAGKDLKNIQIDIHYALK